MDPGEMRNLADDPVLAGVRADLDRRLEAWMRGHRRPAAGRAGAPPPGAVVNDPAGVSPNEPHVAEID